MIDTYDWMSGRANLYNSQSKSKFVLIPDLHGNETRLSFAQFYNQ